MWQPGGGLVETPKYKPKELLKRELGDKFEDFLYDTNIELLELRDKLQNNWNELKKILERRIKSYEDRKKLGEGYELTEVMEISLACDKRFLKDMQELEGNNDNR